MVRASEYDFVQQVELPIIEDINIICEYRPVFEGHAYPPGLGDERDRYTKMIGLTPVVIFEVVTNDYTDQQRRCAFQLSEHETVEIRDSMNRALEQLETMKQSIQFTPDRRKGRTKGK